MKGRLPTPNDKLALRGSRHAREEIAAPVKAMVMPEGLNGDVAACWRSFVDTLPNLTASDTMAFIELCKTKVKLDKGVEDDCERRLLTKLFLELMREFGMTPLSRQRAGIRPQSQGIGERKR